MNNTIFDFVGGTIGEWKVIKMATIKGDNLPEIPYINKISSSLIKNDEGIWTLKGIVSNLRYTEKAEKEQLVAIQEDLGRPLATQAAFIPLRKSAEWWNLAQDERRKIMEESSKHTQTGLKYLPAIARKLFHSRDIGEAFDFLTWFEYAPADEEAFEELLYALRKTEEWNYVDREVDIRLIKV
ncbi:chlorite dismutase family protein [Flavobacterium sp. GSA192]|uniref:chlorite dismutase family protein n=1 Tax=Flavobacterium sp. GSA192 TaxID=2576304 RepID=UPI00112D50B9|nr:chlorite dismutase family protein [Flavobacterium sp. GSA192]